MCKIERCGRGGFLRLEAKADIGDWHSNTQGHFDGCETSKCATQNGKHHGNHMANIGDSILFINKR